jgi:hypothetical protein
LSFNAPARKAKFAPMRRWRSELGASIYRADVAVSLRLNGYCLDGKFAAP